VSVRILLVDDETALLNLMETYMKRLGYEVVKCDQAPKALKLFEADPTQFDVVVADLTMPDMSGEQLTLRMSAVNPSIRVLLCSGYPFELKSLPAAVQSHYSVLQKPFLPKMLVAAVEELLKRKLTPA
jgi:DNA-binding NtrC family response regulator